MIKEFVKKGRLHAETTKSKTLSIHKHKHYVLMKKAELKDRIQR